MHIRSGTRENLPIKPLEISTDCKTLKVQFFWQSDIRVSQGNLPPEETASLLTRPQPTRGFDGYRGQDSCLYNRQAQALLKTGDIFTLTTNDPATHPLPSFELLEMQWFLNRLRGIAGAAEPIDGHYWDDDDEVSNIGFDDMTDESVVSEPSPEKPRNYRLMEMPKSGREIQEVVVRGESEIF